MMRIGVFVNRETTSCKLKMLPSPVRIPVSSSASCLEFMTWYLDFHINTESISAKGLIVWYPMLPYSPQ